MHGKAILKSGIDEIARASRGIVPEPHKGGFQRPIWSPNCKASQLADARWVMAYGQKTQSFMKNGGQQQCLDKALNLYVRLLKKRRKPTHIRLCNILKLSLHMLLVKGVKQTNKVT